VFDVRCWALRKDTGEFGPTRKGVTVDARMLPALVDALSLALRVTTADGTAKGAGRA
jgi:hypothetical protein